MLQGLCSGLPPVTLLRGTIAGYDQDSPALVTSSIHLLSFSTYIFLNSLTHLIKKLEFDTIQRFGGIAYHPAASVTGLGPRSRSTARFGWDDSNQMSYYAPVS